jgi:negative regulator of sigma E activity
MTRTVFAAIAVAASVGLAAPLAAQSSMQKKHASKETTITGCLEKTPGGFQLTNVQSRSSATAPKGTSGASTSEKNTNQTWDLKNGTNLDRHVGHKVRVTGYAEAGMKDQVKGMTGSRGEPTRNFDVRSVTMVSSTCP